MQLTNRRYIGSKTKLLDWIFSEIKNNTQGKSFFDIFSGMMRIYAGIDRSNRTRTVALINRQILDLKRGNFSQEELNQTKKMLRNSVLLAQDRQNTILERAYMASVLGNKFLSLEAWLKALEQVRKDDIIKAAGLLKLQAIYFMEGK